MSNLHETSGTRESHSFINELDILGREQAENKNMEEIILVAADVYDFSVLPIVGL